MKIKAIVLAFAVVMSADGVAAPLADAWQCRAEIDLESMTGRITQGQVDSSEACAARYLKWALGYSGSKLAVVDALKAQHAAFVAYARGLRDGSREIARLRSDLDAAEARVSAEELAASAD